MAEPDEIGEILLQVTEDERITHIGSQACVLYVDGQQDDIGEVIEFVNINGDDWVTCLNSQNQYVWVRHRYCKALD